MAAYVMEVARWMTLGAAAGVVLGILGRPLVQARRHAHRPRR